MKRLSAIVLGLVCLAPFVTGNAVAANRHVRVTVYQHGRPASGVVVEVKMQVGYVSTGSGMTDRSGTVNLLVMENSTRNCWVAFVPANRRIHSFTECVDGNEQPSHMVLQLPL